MKRIDRTGEIRTNTQGYKMKIIAYRSNRDIDVQFENGKCVKTNYQTFKRGKIKNRTYPSVYGIGYIGNTIIMNNKKIKKSYSVWSHMISRCYNKNDREYNIYGNNRCVVYSEWHCYATFEKWYDENYYEIDGEKMHLDKDILIKGNKIYSPKGCVIVPQEINSLFTRRKSKRGSFPIGVSIKNNVIKKYASQCNINKRLKHLGYFDTPEEAFYAYKSFKESYIKQIADEYKLKYSNFPDKLYDAMYDYEVEITD